MRQKEKRGRARERYIELRSDYKREIKVAKLEEMERELESMGDNVWEVCNRWIKGGVKGVKECAKEEWNVGDDRGGNR